jgi:hypothetical protein
MAFLSLSQTVKTDRHTESVYGSIPLVANLFSSISPDALTQIASFRGVTEDDITEDAITLVFSRTGKSYNQKTL